MRTADSASLALAVLCSLLPPCTHRASAQQPEGRPPAPRPVLTPPPAPAAPALAPASSPACALPALAARVPRERASSPLDASEDGATVVALDPDGSALVVLARAGSTLTQQRRFAVGAGPAHVLYASDALVLVSERAAGTVSAYDPRTGQRYCAMPAPADPVGLALSADAQTLYVSSAATSSVTGFALSSGARRFSVAVPREPRALLLSADGARLFVTHAAGQPLSALSLAGATPVPERIPAAPFENLAFFAGGDSTARVSLRPAPSQAWSLARNPSTGSLLIPLMGSNHHVDHGVVGARAGLAGAAQRERPGSQEGQGPAGYGSGGGSFFTDVASAWVGVFDPGELRWRRLFRPRYLDPRDRRARATGDLQLPLASAWDPVGNRLLVCSGGTGVLAEVYVGRRPPGAWENDGAAYLPVPAVPDGVLALGDGTLLVHSSLEHAVALVPLQGPVVRSSLGPEVLEAQLALGRRLFYSSSRRLSLDGVSCAHCHPDGRDDGLRWDLGATALQTPSLAAGRLRAPFGWTGSAATLDALVRVTVQRLGGQGLRAEELSALARYVSDALPAMPAQTEGLDAARVAAGRELFSGAAACASCHRPEAGFTDAQSHRLADARAAFDTPSLLRVGATAPYFHDGRFADLDALLADARSHMGAAAALSAGDRAALAEYLRSL